VGYVDENEDGNLSEKRIVCIENIKALTLPLDIFYPFCIHLDLRCPKHTMKLDAQ